MDYKEENKRTYDTYADDFDTKFSEHLKNIQQFADEFLSELKGNRILDAGCGSGNHAEYFKDHGLDVFGIDISEEMVARAKAKGVNAQVMDLENIHFLPESFDGIWAYASLLHVPKDKIQKVVSDLASKLRPGGLFAGSVKKGEGERFETHEKYPGTQRLFVYYGQDELKDLFKGFELVSMSEAQARKNIFIHFLFRKHD